jgi:hypothetical protein
MTASSAPSPEDGVPYADRRAYPRVELALPALLQANGERHSVQLLDLSAGGAKLNCPASVPNGTSVILDCGTLSLAAEVRWQGGPFLGLCFSSELDAREVSALIDRSKALTARMKTRE